ncbi:MAG: DEAD/DEAH box helicase, partial [Nitrospinota bacterium]
LKAKRHLMENLDKFKALGLSENIIAALQKKGFEEPTKIQELVIPTLLEGKTDLIGQAQTGTGKTAAFGLPLLELLDEKARHVQAVILAPTRELAIQISTEINSIAGNKRLQVIPIYGGQSIVEQLRRLKKGAHIVVGTPGRVLDHLQRKSLSLSEASYIVLDEADEMLNMGFIDDVETILGHFKKDKKMLLFSATMPTRLKAIADKYMKKDKKMVSVKKEQLTTNLTDQIYFEVGASDKFEALTRIIDIEKDFYALIFCRTKIDVQNVTSKLKERGYDADMLHGDMSQSERERTLFKFKNKRINILVATDVAARGIDVNDLTHVINFSLPQDPESYVHRIGRTGRAGKEGTAITFVTREEYRKLLFIKRVVKAPIRKEKLPNVGEVIKFKTSKIKEEVRGIIQDESYTTYLQIAEKLLENEQPEVVLASLLKHSFQAELDERSYSEIREVSIDRKGTTRLFVARGKADNMTPGRLVSFIKNQADVPEKKIRDVQVFDKFSFLTVPFEDAEFILDSFKQTRRGQRPIVSRAKSGGSSRPTAAGRRPRYQRPAFSR